MTAERFCELAGRLMRCPAVAYHEQAVRAEAELICAEHGLLWHRDRFGNLIVRLLTAPKTRTLVLAAHMDHPGFEIIRALSPERWLGRFLGGVPQNYFRAGIPLRLLPDGRAATLGPAAAKPKQFEIYAVKRRAPRKRLQTERSRNSAPAQFAVWELEDFAVRDGRLHGRSCDDLIGVAAVLSTLIELKERRARVNVIGVISRAEEIGFLGALTIATQKILPADSLIISLETSREIPPIQIGEGVIIRVGDRSSIFDSRATRFLSEVAQGLKRKEASFQFQRALMSGGTCEATAYQEFGFQTGAACIALGNYHNCGAREKIQAEFVSISDAGGMVSLMVEVARQMPAYTKLVSKLPRHLHNLLQTARKTLPR
jgi:putative aminopeptidase FrvX